MQDPVKKANRLKARAAIYLDCEYKRKMSKAAVEAQNRPEVKAAKSSRWKGVAMQDDQKIKIGRSVKEKLADPEVKERLRAAVKAAWAKRKAKGCLQAQA